MVSYDLPQEILIDIFSRLPAKSVGQCRCVSKPWRDTLSSPHFIKSHLNRKTHQENRILIAKPHSSHSIATTKDGAASREFELPFQLPEIVGSCDGLVLLVNEDDDKFLVNPATLEKVMIPDSPLVLKHGESGIPNRDSYINDYKIVTVHGFGYDSSVDDYKIVTLYYHYSEDPDCEETFVDVYFVKRGVWKRVESSPYDHAFPDPHSGAFLNGAIHWMARARESRYCSVLVAFDLYDEVFTEIPTPDDIKMKKFDFCGLAVLGGCLCIIYRNNNRTNVWIMKEYGVVESWTKLNIDTFGKSSILKPLCFVGDEEIVSIVKGRTLGVYNLKERTLRDMVVDGVPTVSIEDAITFVPSLVSPANVDNAFLSDVALLEASAGNLAWALNTRSVLVQRLEDCSTIVSALARLVDKSREDKAELRRRKRELCVLTRDHNKLQADIRRLFAKLVERFQVSPPRVEEHEALSELEMGWYENVVRRCRRQLREPGQVAEDVVMLIRPPDVPEVATPAEVLIDEGNIGC